MNRLEVLGWWFNERAPNAYPRPQLLVSRWDPEERAAVSGYLRAGRTLVAYREDSFCRFACGERDMGRRDLTDGVFVWPDGLVHYVDRHEVRLPERFLAHVLSRGAKIAPFVMPEPAFGRFDTGPWLAWARARRACLDLDGWEIPTRDAARRIGAELAGVRFEAIALCRGDTRQVVLVLADGSLEVHQLRPGGHARQVLAGWHLWPIAT
jgi:hypothetical protein